MKITLQAKKQINAQNQFAFATIDSNGAELISLQDQFQKEYLWNADPIYWKRSAPLLFPVIGNLRNGKTIISGHSYAIPKHGFARDLPFTLVEQSPHHAVFRLESSAKTQSFFPFSFQLSIRYELNAQGLSTTYSVTNLSENMMYYQIGAHPAFLCPIEPNTVFEDYIVQFETEETCQCPTYDFTTMQILSQQRTCYLNHTNQLPLTYDLFQQDALIFDDLQSRSVSLLHKDHKTGIRVDFPDFAMLGLWTPKPSAPFLCIEPWNGAAIFDDESDEFCERRCIQTAQPNETKQYQLHFSLVH